MVVTMSESELYAAQALAYRLLLAQLDGDEDALQTVEGEIEPDILERPDRMRAVLGCMLGAAAGMVTALHKGNKAEAAKAVEQRLTKALDALDAAQREEGGC